MRACTAIPFALVIAVATLLHADEPASRPTRSAPLSAKTTEEVIKFVEPQKGFGCIQTAQFNRWGRQVFAIWYCPFSGRGDCFLDVYYYDYDKTQWTCFLDRLVPAGGDLSAEMPNGNEIVFRNTDGKVAVTQSVVTFPQKKWWNDAK